MKRKNFISILVILVLSLSLVFTNSTNVQAVEDTNVINDNTLTITNLKTKESNPQPMGTKVKIGVAAKGEGLKYKFIIMKDNEIVYSKGYSTKNYAYWTANSPGDFKIYCKVKDSNGKEISSSIDFMIYDSNIVSRNLIIDEAYKHLGKPYIYGANGPNSFDSSGFTEYVFKKALGINIGRTTYHQINMGKDVDYKDLQPGDLVFPHADHVGIYVGNGLMIHSPKTGDVVRVSNIYKFWRGIRVIQ